MSDIKLFSIENGTACEIAGEAVALEKSLQTLIERNLESLLGVRFLASEYSTGPQHGGRIDTLGIDENGCPVIIEYKRSTNENVINQGLFYLDWLLDHRAELQLLVMQQRGGMEQAEIDWSSPRLLCIAGGFTRYDEHAVKQMNRNIELIRYRRFGDDLLLFELVNATTAMNGETAAEKTAGAGATYKTITESLASLSTPLADLHAELEATLISQGDDVQRKVLKYYVAYKRLKNFACVEAHPSKGCLTVYVKVDPDTVEIVNGFTRDVRSVGHYGTGDLEITLRSRDDLERAKPLLIMSYEAS